MDRVPVYAIQPFRRRVGDLENAPETSGGALDEVNALARERLEALTRGRT